MIYENKENIKSKKVFWPVEVTNFNRKSKVCRNSKEALEHILCRKELKNLTLILTAKFHPDDFITHDSYVLISRFCEIEKHKINFFYQNINEIPNIVYQSIETIHRILDDNERKKMQAINNKQKQLDKSKRSGVVRHG